VPLQVVEFWLTVRIKNKDVSEQLLFQLLAATLMMLFFGYIGESGHSGPIGFQSCRQNFLGTNGFLGSSLEIMIKCDFRCGNEVVLLQD